MKDEEGDSRPLSADCGDYNSTADRPAEFSPHEGDWEGIPTTNESYGWNQNDHSHKPAAHFIQLLAKAAARGGNLLMNIGPRGDGLLDPPDVAILQGIGQWWKTNGESIRGTTRTPLAVQAWGESTRKGNTLYLHVFQWPGDGRLVVGGLKSPVKRAFLLADPGRAPIKVERLNPLDLSLSVPRVAPDPVDTVVALECEGDIQTDPARLLQPALARDTLRAFDAELRGGLRFGPGKTRDAWVYGWSNRADSVSWHLRLNQPAAFEVAAVFDADAASAGNTFKLTTGSNSIEGTVQAGEFKAVSVGRLQLSAGTHELRLEPSRLNGRELFRLRHLDLKSIQP